MSKYLVVGASGSVGSQIVRNLVAQGHAVRGTTHRRDAIGADGAVETAYLDLVSGEGRRTAFTGVDGAFLLVPPGYADQHRIASPLIAEAKRQQLGKVVLMTAMGANAADTPFRRAEQELAASGVPYNVIRPNWFMQNFQTFWIRGINEQGKILLPAGSAKTSFIDARDIAAVAARLLTSHDQDGRDFDLTGPEALDHDEVAREISAAIGRIVTYQEIEPDVLRQGLLASGVPADYTEFLLVILDFLKQGYNARVTDAVERLLQRSPTGFRDYARDNAASWNVRKVA